MSKKAVTDVIEVARSAIGGHVAIVDAHGRGTVGTSLQVGPHKSQSAAGGPDYYEYDENCTRCRFEHGLEAALVGLAAH